MSATHVAVVAAVTCWHFCLTTFLIPAHSHDRASHGRQLTPLTPAIEACSVPISPQHHADDCQFCKLESQLQLFASEAPNCIESPAADLLVTQVHAPLIPLLSTVNDNRAPPGVSLTIAA